MPNKKQMGFSIPEALVSVAVLTIAVGAMISFISHLHQMRRRERIDNALQSLAEDIENKLKTPSNILFSLSDHSINPHLSQCALGLILTTTSSGAPKTGGCQFPPMTLQGGTQPFALLVPNTNANTAGNLTQISSSNSNPSYYDINGAPCTLTSTALASQYNDECAFQANTYFYANCDMGTDPKCVTGASELYVGYVVFVRKGALQNLPQMDTTRNDMYQASITYNAAFPLYPKVQRYFPISINEVFGANKYTQCYFNSTMTGIDAKGRAICQCLAPAVQKGQVYIYAKSDVLISPKCVASGSSSTSTTKPSSTSATCSPKICGTSGAYISTQESVCVSNCLYDPTSPNQSCTTTKPGPVHGTHSLGVVCYTAQINCCRGPF